MPRTIDTIDAELRILHHYWRTQRINGLTRQHRQRIQTNFNQLLDERLQATETNTVRPVGVGVVRAGGVL